ncbi:MAG: hypothetical protein ACOC34_04360 [Thermotogota bacterium]
MKKNFVIVFFVLFFSSFFFVSCIDLIVGLTPPDPKTPIIKNMTVTLSWGGVEKAESYLLTINSVSNNEGLRDITFPVEKVVYGTSFNWEAPVPGVYSWKLRATNDRGASRWINGQNFTVDPSYEPPEVNITYPAEGQIVNSLSPTIEWTAEPGTLTHTQPRAYKIETCEVFVSEGSEEIYNASGVHGTNNHWSVELPNGVLEYGKTYGLRVTANQEEAVSEGEDELTFKAPTGIGLELSEASMYNCGILVATVTAYDPDIDKVALFGKLQSELDYLQIAPSQGWRELNNNRQATFQIEVNKLGVGDWLINAQSSGSSSKSTEKLLEIKEINLIPNLTVRMCDKTISDGEYVYIDAQTGFPTTATYTVDVELDEKLSDIISEFFFVFEYAGADTVVKTSPNYTFDTWNATDIAVTMATECTKAATVSLFGRSYCDDQFNYHNFDSTSLSFTLDGTLPEITFDNHEFGEQKNTLKIPIHLSDTKSLSQATISLLAEKVDVNGNQMPGWGEKEIPWGVQTVTVGTGENKIEGVISYSDPIVFGQTTTADATIQLSLGKLDGATLTSTVTAIDCEGYTTNVCSEEVLRNSSTKSVGVFFDNRFYQQQHTNISFFDESDFAQLDHSWLLTKDNDTGMASFCFTDAYIDDTNAVELSLTGSVYAVSVNGTSSLKENIIAECTGYPLKNEVCLLIAMTAIQDVETSVDAQLTAMDQHGNSTETTQRIIIDTKSPVLNSVDGHLGQSSGNTGDDYVEFAFRVSDKGQHPTFDGATVTVNGNPDKKQWYQYLGPVHDYNTQRGIVRLNEDHQFRVNFDDSSWGLIEDGTVSVEMIASDKYNNSGYTNKTGNVFNP